MKHLKLFILIILLSGIFTVFAAEIVLAKYDFSTKSKLPVVNASGVTFGSEFGIWNSTANNMQAGISDDGYMLIREYGTGVIGTCYGYISITPDAGKTIKITKTVIKHLKVEGSNTNRTRSYLYNMEGSTPKDNPTVVCNLIYNGTGGSVIPSVLTEQTFTPNTSAEFNSVRFMSFSATQNTANTDDLSQWKIQELTFYGNVLSPGDIVVTDPISFGNVLAGNSVDASVSLKVMGGTTIPVHIELIDPTNSFECLQTQVDAVDATAGTAIKISYVPTVPGKHTAQIKFTYADKVAYTNLSGICPILNENFTYYVSDPLIWATMKSTKVNDYNQADYLMVPGWQFTDSVYWHLSGSYGLGLELRGSNSMVPKVTTPNLNLSTPFGLMFRSKKTDNRTTLLGQMYVLVDQDTIWSYVNPNNTFNLQTVDGFVAKGNSKISFVGIANDSSRIAIDEISVYPTTTPTLDLPAYFTKSFNKGSDPVVVEIPFKAYQLTDDLKITSVGDASGYEILTPAISKTEAEAGSTIKVRYSPVESPFSNASLMVSGGGLTDYRYITLKPNSLTGLNENKLNASVFVKAQSIYVIVDHPTNLEIFSCDGKKIAEKMTFNNSEIHVNQGFYIVKLTNNNTTKIVKVLVN